MAENKQSFLLYCDTIHTVEKLTDAQAGLLFKHLLRYVNDKDPAPPDIITEIAFEPIKQSLKRDLKKYESKREQNKKNALKRWNANASDGIKDTANDAVSDSVIVSDNVIVSEKVSNDAQKNFLKESNLFRAPKVPSFEDVHRIFLQNGGTQEMAKTFFDSNTATDWYHKGSPITNFSSMVPNYIRNWKTNENGKTHKRFVAASKPDPGHPDHVATAP